MPSHTYLLLLHETPADATAMSAAELQAVVQRYAQWAQGLARAGRLVGGEKLVEDGGRHLRLQGGQVVASDGPYAEAQDVVGGYFLIHADSDAQAEEIARSCPHLEGRQWVEVRRIEPIDREST